MSIELRVETLSSERALVSVGGEVDLATAPELAAVLERTLADGGRTIVLDLTDVEFIDTSGVGVMLEARRQISEKNADLAVVAPPNSPARRLLELTELIEPLAVVDSIEDTSAEG
jgi:anti-sigma B factor antagonist